MATRRENLTIKGSDVLARGGCWGHRGPGGATSVSHSPGAFQEPTLAASTALRGAQRAQRDWRTKVPSLYFEIPLDSNGLAPVPAVPGLETA